MKILIFSLLLACGGPPEEALYSSSGGDEEPDRRVLVEAEPVVRGSVSDHLETSGTIDSEVQADIVPETTGVITEIFVEEGDVVTIGQVLAELANPSLDAGASRAGIELERAARELNKAKGLYSQGAISDRELQEARDALRTAQASYNEATRTRGFTRITSPIAGTVTMRDVRLGEVAGTSRAFQVVDLSQLRVVVQLPEKDLARLSMGQVARLAGAYDEEASASGSISRISPVVDPGTGTVRVIIALDPDQETLRPGQFVKAQIEVDRHDDVLTIPRRALVWEDGESVAWVVVDAPAETVQSENDEEEADGGFWSKMFGDEEAAEEETSSASFDYPRRVAEQRRLRVDFVDAIQVEVLEGVEEGELVITVGNTMLRPETPVRLPDDPVLDTTPPEDAASGDAASGDEDASVDADSEPDAEEDSEE